MVKNLSNSVKYIGTDDVDLKLFENQYFLPEGMAYNSYLILDEKVTVRPSSGRKTLRKRSREGLRTIS